MTFKTTYKRLKLLGAGSFGSAYLVQKRDGIGIKLAAKEVQIAHMSETQREATKAEADLLQQISHPNVVAYVDSFLEGSKLYIVMEYADGGDLARRIRDAKEEEKNIRESRILMIFAQLALALEHIHGLHILHRDIKPLNIFLTKQNAVKLGDFGVARIIDASVDGAQTQIGTPFYISPEVMKREAYGTKSDLWALGVVTYELAQLKVPFLASCLPAVAVMICEAEPEPLPSIYTQNLATLVFGLLTKDPEKRPFLHDILADPGIRRCVEAVQSRFFSTAITPEIAAQRGEISVALSGCYQARAGDDRQVRVDPEARRGEPTDYHQEQRRRNSNSEAPPAGGRQRCESGAGRSWEVSSATRSDIMESPPAGMARRRSNTGSGGEHYQHDYYGQGGREPHHRSCGDGSGNCSVVSSRSETSMPAAGRPSAEARRRPSLEGADETRDPFQMERRDSGGSRDSGGGSREWRGSGGSGGRNAGANENERRRLEALERARIAAHEDRKLAKQRMLARQAEINGTAGSGNFSARAECAGGSIGSSASGAGGSPGCEASMFAEEQESLVRSRNSEAAARKQEQERARLHELERARLAALEDRRIARQRLLEARKSSESLPDPAQADAVDQQPSSRHGGRQAWASPEQHHRQHEAVGEMTQLPQSVLEDAEGLSLLRSLAVSEAGVAGSATPVRSNKQGEPENATRRMDQVERARCDSIRDRTAAHQRRSAASNGGHQDASDEPNEGFRKDEVRCDQENFDGERTLMPSLEADVPSPSRATTRATPQSPLKESETEMDGETTLKPAAVDDARAAAVAAALAIRPPLPPSNEKGEPSASLGRSGATADGTPTAQQEQETEKVKVDVAACKEFDAELTMRSPFNDGHLAEPGERWATRRKEESSQAVAEKEDVVDMPFEDSLSFSLTNRSGLFGMRDSGAGDGADAETATQRRSRAASASEDEVDVAAAGATAHAASLQRSPIAGSLSQQQPSDAASDGSATRRAVDDRRTMLQRIAARQAQAEAGAGTPASFFADSFDGDITPRLGPRGFELTGETRVGVGCAQNVLAGSESRSSRSGQLHEEADGVRQEPLLDRQQAHGRAPARPMPDSPANGAASPSIIAGTERPGQGVDDGQHNRDGSSIDANEAGSAAQQRELQRVRLEELERASQNALKVDRQQEAQVQSRGRQPASGAAGGGTAAAGWSASEFPCEDEDACQKTERLRDSPSTACPSTRSDWDHPEQDGSEAKDQEEAMEGTLLPDKNSEAIGSQNGGTSDSLLFGSVAAMAKELAELTLLPGVDAPGSATQRHSGSRPPLADVPPERSARQDARVGSKGSSATSGDGGEKTSREASSKGGGGGAAQGSSPSSLSFKSAMSNLCRRTSVISYLEQDDDDDDENEASASGCRFATARQTAAASTASTTASASSTSAPVSASASASACAPAAASTSTSASASTAATPSLQTWRQVDVIEARRQELLVQQREKTREFLRQRRSYAALPLDGCVLDPTVGARSRSAASASAPAKNEQEHMRAVDAAKRESMEWRRSLEEAQPQAQHAQEARRNDVSASTACASTTVSTAATCRVGGSSTPPASSTATTVGAARTRGGSGGLASSSTSVALTPKSGDGSDSCGRLRKTSSGLARKVSSAALGVVEAAEGVIDDTVRLAAGRAFNSAVSVAADAEALEEAPLLYMF
eukprot:TRINITY_DN10077_c0_g1_i2.p1 TRINITY_DN10077_c0_g1~~TRINITY_DN10077_c0_g1_i2.p1  ORF type:complete len:1687 (+),score=365.87 TRINITY_DN10077_c0_g1_i2:103-5163(+)